MVAEEIAQPRRTLAILPGDPEAIFNSYTEAHNYNTVSMESNVLF